MRNIRIEKVTLNFGAGKDQNRLEKGVKLLKMIAGVDPMKTTTNKRIIQWGLRPGLPIGCKVTLRKKKAKDILVRLLEARDNKLKLSYFDKNGSVAFGIPEYIDIPGVNYDPEIGIVGLQVCVTLERPGFRIKRRKLQKKKIPHKHQITKEDAMEFMKKEFNTKTGEVE